MKDSQPAEQYTFTKILDEKSFNINLVISRKKKNKFFNLEKLKDLYNLEGDGKVFDTVSKECKKQD